jgi:hypothetical protein
MEQGAQRYAELFAAILNEGGRTSWHQGVKRKLGLAARLANRAASQALHSFLDSPQNPQG